MSEPIYERRPFSAVTKTVEGERIVLTTLPSLDVDGDWGGNTLSDRPPSDMKFVQAIVEAIQNDCPVVLRSCETGAEIPVEPGTSLDALSIAWSNSIKRQRETNAKSGEQEI